MVSDVPAGEEAGLVGPCRSWAGLVVRPVGLTAHFKMAFYYTRSTCVMIMLFNHILDMPHFSGGWIILKKAKMLTNRDVTNTLHVAFIFMFSVERKGMCF